MKHNFVKIILIMAVCVTSTLLAGHPETNKLVNQAKKETGEIEPKKLKKMLDEGKEVILLDVREINQRAEGEIFADDHIAITRGSLEFEVLNKIKNKNALIVTYCRGGYRSALATQTLRKLGYKNSVNLKGGLRAWAKEGYDIETGLGVTHLYTK